MIVTAWNNGKRHPTGAGYGVKISIKDRRTCFNKRWKDIFLDLENGVSNIININKQSFWDCRCRELVKKEIGGWLLGNNLAPWDRGNPPQLEMKKLGERKFKLYKKRIIK